MSRVDELPADQRAALSLLLRQRKSYAEVATLLGIPERAVHDRAHAALAVLAPRQARELDPARREEIGEYMLGQQPAEGARLRTRTLLATSPPANAWASAVAGELAPLADGAPPEVPALSGEGAPEQAPYPLSQAASAPAPPPAEGSARTLPSSRRGGAILLAVLAAVVAVVVILILTGGSSSKHSSTTTGSATATTGPKHEGTITLHAPPGSGSKGTVEILSEGEKRAFYIQAEHLPKTRGFFYAVWLYNSPTSALALSKSPPVGNTHKLAGAALLPSTAGKYKEILLTKETSTRPRKPGKVVLRGNLNLGG